MFVVKSNEEIGSHLRELILGRYKSVRLFCRNYLKINNQDDEDPTEIRNLTNRFSQILNGKKSIQTYDLPIISELLGVSCEDILSCGETKVPLTNRRTNYNIAFSNNRADWEEYLSREDCIAAYADEFGKTVLDYAVEFKNYGFIKYLIEQGYIKLISENPDWHDVFNFGAESKIKERPYQHKTAHEEFYENKLLRSQILSLAIANDDIESLEIFRARQLPPQLTADVYSVQISFDEYYDENFIKEITKSHTRVFDYFIQEYELKASNSRFDVGWLYPFVGKVAIESIKSKNNDKALKALSAIIEHNKNVFDKLHKNFLLAAKETKNVFYPGSFQDAIKMVGREFHISVNKDYVSFWPHFIREIEPIAFNIIKVDYSSKDASIQSKINAANDLYNRIIDLPNNLIKNN